MCVYIYNIYFVASGEAQVLQEVATGNSTSIIVLLTRLIFCSFKCILDTSLGKKGRIERLSYQF